MSNSIYDIGLLGGIVLGGFCLSMFAYNAVEILYWKYADWKYGEKQ
tara:strand:+ start:1648 stop:1785 length:138 start_codon:yes stop_codon:yes gene_type:complete